MPRADVRGSRDNGPMTDVTRLPRALRPFSSGQYRLLTIALAASLLSAGAWIVSAVWQVVELGGTPIDLSFVAVGSSLGLVLAVLFGVAGARELLRGVDFVGSAAAAIAGADAVVLVTEWREFGELDFLEVAGAMRGTLVVDGRNFFDPDAVAAAGLTYEGVGRAARSRAPVAQYGGT